MASTFNRPWPHEVRLDGPVACKVISEDRKTQRYVYESPGYRFNCDARVTDDALRNFSVMFESIRKYAQQIPVAALIPELGGFEAVFQGQQLAISGAEAAGVEAVLAQGR